MKTQIDTLLPLWYWAKEAEAKAISERREIEDKLAVLLQLDSTKDGTTTIENSDFVVKVTQRIDRKVDSERLQEIAAECGLSDHLASLFRWKPEINAKAWAAADSNITTPLASAITAKPSRPSFSITRKE